MPILSPTPALSTLASNNPVSRLREDRNPFRRFGPLRPLPLLHAARSALAALRFLPIFTPRKTLARWRSQRALRAAARDASHAVNKRTTKHEFRLNGLTWHNLYIIQDLRRINMFLRYIQTRMDKGDTAVSHAIVPLERSFAFLADNVWSVYNILERDVLFPWIARGVEQPAVSRALHMFSKERQRIENAADHAHERLARLVCATGHTHTSAGPCSSNSTFRAIRNKSSRRRHKSKTPTRHVRGEQDGKARSEKAALNLRHGYQPEEGANLTFSTRPINADDVRQAVVDITKIVDDCENLHETKSGLLYPLIANTFPEREQSQLTLTLVYSMRSTLAKFIITIYHQAVEKQSSRLHWNHYKREVPLPIRVYTSVWRARLYDDSPLGWLRSTKLRDITR
ncbi:hypothetical protein BWQ96_08758 [Gracilariopsis chorda]|uniref:Uncharacterized protein n=1 Tax=Gracilariopsis chorda TaxID=448386 RepID=A0A2V3IHH6_9FLOR|nr:hypothetical protein BWQ96_08758 [Gracilariopsis chorda]|eukprot:PXF41555.1 hypothetical protein BWQ96_08758 [Gracilariopsis chorda]